MIKTQKAMPSDPMRVPPHSVEAEQAVLGGLMLEGAAWDAVADIVTADDFYRNDHRLIFDAAAAVAAGSQAIDVVTLSEYLERIGRLEDAGGLAYLGTLARDTPSAANIRAYAEIVRERSLLRRLISTGSEITTSAFNTEGRSARELVDDAERRVFEIAEAGARGRGGAVRVGTILSNVVDRIDRLYRNPNDLRGVPTGFAELDKMTGGLQKGDLIIVAGRPSMGKTTLAVNIAENATLGHGIPSAVFSMEMSAEQVTLRMISSLGRINQGNLRTGRLTEEDWPRIDSAMTQLSQAKFFIDETPGLTPTDLRARARRLKREHNLGLIVVDYLQLMSVPGTKENRATEISEISRSMKALARELEVPVIALSQLNRGVEQRVEKKPVMSDLRECVTGETLVCLTDGRRVPIHELVGTQPEVWAVDPYHCLIPARSDKVWKVGTRRVYRLDLASGRSIRVTAEHRLLAAGGWTTVEQLEPGCRLALAREIPEPAEARRWPDHHVILLGHLVGDGSYLRHQPLRYTTASKANSEAVRRAAEQFGSTVTRHVGRGQWHQLVISGNGNRWQAAGVGLWLKELGIFNQRSHEKRLPQGVFCLPNDQIALLLRHLWATDGSISVRRGRGQPGVHFTSVSRGLAMDVAALLLRMGIVARIRTTHAATGRPWHTVFVSGSESQLRFARLVGAFGPRVGPLEALLAHHAGRAPNTNVDTVPKEVFASVRALMKKRGVTTRQMAQMRGTAYGGSAHFKFAPSRAVVADYAYRLDSEELLDVATSDLFWDRVVAITPDGEEDVFDLTVPGPANWLADGIVTHNSGALEQDADLILMIYREEVYEPNTPRKGIADIIIAKQRNGPTGDIQLTFLGAFTKFENYAPDTYGEGVLR